MADKTSSLDQLRVLSADELTTAGIKLAGQPSLAQELAQNDLESQRNTTLDTAVGIFDTLQTISTAALSPLPGVELADIGRMSQELDQFRSPGYLAERARDAQLTAEVSQAEGQWAGFKEGFSRALQGDNTLPDVLSQAPYLAIGPAARALGFAAAAEVPGVLGKVTAAVGGTSQGAIINRIAMLSGALEGAGGYSQTYQRAIEQGLSPEEADAQAQKAGLAAAVAGTVLGRLTPGFELDPLGLRRGGPAGKFLGDVLAPSLSNVASEAVEEGGMAITNQVADNILAGKDPMEGVGGQVGQAVAISSAFSGGMQSPGLIRDTSRAIGRGVREGLASVASSLETRAVTPERAATAAVDTAPTAEEVIQSTEAVTPPVDAAPAVDQPTDAPSPEPTPVEAVSPDVTPTPESVLPDAEAAPAVEGVPPETGVYEAQISDSSTRTQTSNSDAVATVLAAVELDQKAASTEGETQAAVISQALELEDAGKVAEAQQKIANISDSALESHIEKATQGNEQSQMVIDAVAATDITRLPTEVVPAPLRPVVAALKAVPGDGKLDDVTNQILERGFDNGQKTSKKRKGVQEYIQSVINVASHIGDSTNGVDMARRLAVFMKQLENRAALFDAAAAQLDTPEIKKQGYIDVAGTETLDANGKLIEKPFRIWVHSDKSRNVPARVRADADEARRRYDIVKKTWPQMFAEAENYAGIEMERRAVREAAAAKIAEAVNPDLAAKKAEVAPVAAASAPATPTPRRAPVAEQSAAELETAIKGAIETAPSVEKLAAVGERIAARASELNGEVVDNLRQLYAAKKEALTERAAIQAEEAAAEARIAQEQAANAAEAAAEREAIQAESRAAEERLAREADAAKPVSVPDSGTDNVPVGEPTANVPKNPLLHEGVKWVTDIFKKAFRIDPEVSLETQLAKLNPADRAFLESKAKELYDRMKTKLVERGIQSLVTADEKLWKNKPYGVASHLFVKETRTNEDGTTYEVTTIPDDVIRAYAYASVLHMIRGGARYESALVEEEDGGDGVTIRRDAVPAAWAAEIARDAMMLLGVKGKRNQSLTFTQGIPMTYGLMAVQALVDTKNFVSTEQNDADKTEKLQEEIGSNGYMTRVLIPRPEVHEFALKELERVDRMLKTLGAEAIWTASTEPSTVAPTTIQYTSTPTSEKQQTAILNRQKVPHTENKQMYQLLDAIKGDNLLQLLLGYYRNDLPNTLPESVQTFIKSVRAGWLNEMKAADHYHNVSEQGSKPLFFRYEIGTNNRSKSVMGPQSNKLLRDLYSSAYETLDLSNANHRMFLNMALAQAFDVKTDINGPSEVLEQWEVERPKHEKLALDLQAALEGNAKPDEIMALLQRNKPYSPRQLNALLTLGRMLKHGDNPGFENYLAFEIDGKTNGAFNTELFFGLGVRTPANLEQGGLMLEKPNTTWQAERARIERTYGKDFYTRLNKIAENRLAKLFESQADWMKKNHPAQLELLQATGLVKVNTDGSFSFERLAGKTGALPVQYGGAVKGVQNQMWSLMSGNLVKSYLEKGNELRAVQDKLNENPNDESLLKQKRALLVKLNHLSDLMIGMDSMRKTDFKKMNPAEKTWHNATKNISQALLDAYKQEKPAVAAMTELMVKLTNFAFAFKAAQWTNETAKRLKKNPLNENIQQLFGDTNKVGGKINGFAASEAEYEDINRGTLDISFSTLAGDNVLSLNDTEISNEGNFTVNGFGTSLTGNLNIPTPRAPGVRVLALLTIAAGDAAMGNEFLQVFRAITDVYDGIEFKVSEFMNGGEALNDAVWKTFQHDTLKDFFPLMKTMLEKLDQIALAQADTSKATGAEIDLYAEIVKQFNAIQVGEGAVESFEDFVLAMKNTFLAFETAYNQHRLGAQELQSKSHTLIQMGGGRGKTTEAVPVRDSLDELTLVEDDAPTFTVADLSQSGTREAGLYPDQYKAPNATRIEDKEGLIDVVQGDRWKGSNTWNSPDARKGAGIRRLVKVLRMAAEAGKAYDSDVSVHPSALKMYIRAIDNGLITAEYNREAVNEAIANNQVLRSSEPIFRDVRLVGRAAKGTIKSDKKLETLFQVTNGKMDRNQIIAALNQIQWPTAVQRVVWKRIQTLLPATVTVHLAKTAEEWATVQQEMSHGRRYGTVTGVAVGNTVALSVASPQVMLHELIHTVFTQTISNYFTNINQVPVELRGPINDLVQLMARFKKLPPVGRVGFVQRVMNHLEFMGDNAAALDEMLTYVISEQAVIAELSPGFVSRVINRVKQIFSGILKVNIPNTFLNDVMSVFHQLADNIPVERTAPAVQPSLVRNSISNLEQLTEDAYVDMMQRIAQQQIRAGSLKNVLKDSYRDMVEAEYNLSAEQQLMYDRVFTLLRVQQRPAELEEFVTATLPNHPQKNLFNGAKDVVASAMALAAVEPVFRDQLESLWLINRGEQKLVDSLMDKALNNAQSLSVEDMLNKAFSAMMVDREYNSSFLGTATSRLDRLGSDMLNRLGQKASDLADKTPDGISQLLAGVSALTSERGAAAFGQGLLEVVNTYTDQRWLQDLVAAVLGTQGDGKLIYRAHNEMMGAISGTKAVFTTTLPKALKTLFPKDFDGWNTLFQSFGRLDVGVLGSAAREMYLNDAERKRMITVLESKVDNYIDAQNLGYYLVHRKIKPGSAQPLLRNARAIADNLNGTIRKAPDSLVMDVDQLVTLYAIDALAASERAKVAQMFTAHPEAMDNLIGMLQKVNAEAVKDSRNEYRYTYWKDSLPLSVDDRASVIVAGAIKGASLEQLGYVKGERYQRTSGDPASDLHYYTRRYAPPPVFTQGILSTVQQTAMGINYTTAATISPEVGTMITDPRLVEFIKRNQGRDSTLVPIFNFQGEIVGYERLLDPAIVNKTLKADNTLLHISIGKKLGRITEEHMAKAFNRGAINLLVKQWEEGKAKNQVDQYEPVNSSSDKQVARAWEVIPAETKKALEDAFGGPVMIRKDLLANSLGYYKAGVLEIYTGDASIDDKTRKALIGLAQTLLLGPRSAQILAAAEALVKEGVATARDFIIVRSLSVPINNFMAAAHQVIANGVPLSTLLRRYRQGMREIRDYTRLQREVINLTVQIAGTTDSGEKERLRTIQNAKRRSQERLSIYPLIAAGDLADLPEGLEESPNNSYLGDLSGWVDRHLKEKIHPKAPVVLANVLFAKDSELHDAMSKAIQAGDFLARYAIYMHMVDSGKNAEEARDEVRDELISYQTNPGRLRATLEDYGLVWWSQFTLRAQAVILRRIRRNPFSFFLSQATANLTGTPGPLSGVITERGWDNSTGLDNVITSPSAYMYAKLF